MIRTTYYANMKVLDKNENFISISRFQPKGVNIKSYLKLAPTDYLLRSFKDGIINEEEFTYYYQDIVLDNLDPHEVVRELGENPILLCYCGKGKFCHRHILANFLRGAGYEVEEIEKKSLIDELL